MRILFSILRTIFFSITFKLLFTKKYKGKTIRMEDGLEFIIFRHMKLIRNKSSGAIFIVRFKFKQFSHNINKRASRIPIPLIAGFPGFRDKIWMIDWKTGYWQGFYQWDSIDDIEKYEKVICTRRYE